MIEVKCVFDRELLDSFAERANVKLEIDNKTMFFGAFEDGVLTALLPMFPEKENGIIGTVLEEGALFGVDELLLKSTINFALTCDLKKIVVRGDYEKWLIPMGFEKVGDQFEGDPAKIDFPHACGGCAGHK